jgi:MraZ protein
MYPGRVDDKGRLKVPVGFQEYLAGKKLFVTSLDRRIAQIYPMAVWRENEKFFQNYRANPKSARLIAFNANDLGAETEMDNQGRVLFPPELRRELGIENSTVRMFANKGRIEIYSEPVYQEWRKTAAESSQEALAELEGAGLL